MAYEILDEEEPTSSLPSLPRQALQYAARLGEGALGLPGDIAAGALGLGNMAYSAVTGKEGPLPARLGLPASKKGDVYQALKNIYVGDTDKAYEEFNKEIPEEERSQGLYLPTSSDIRKHVTQGLTGKALEPQGGVEEFIGDVAGVVPALFNPAGAATKVELAKNVGKALFKGVKGKGVRHFLKHLGFGEAVQGIGEFATYLLGDLNPKAIADVIERKYEPFTEALKEKSPVESVGPKISTAIKRLEKQSKIGHPSAEHKQWMQSRIKEVTDAMATEGPVSANAIMDVENAYNALRDLNAEWKNGTVPVGAEGFFNDLKELIYRPIMEKWGKVNAPDAYKNFVMAEDTFKATRNASTAKKIIDSLTTSGKVSTATGGLLLGLPFLKRFGINPLGAIGGLGAAAAAKRTFDIADPLFKNLNVWGLYGDVLKYSMAGNVAAATKSAEKLDKIVAKQMAPSRFEILD